jgi:hypothetical protein
LQCVGCTKLFHPVCIGKGLSAPALYRDNRRGQAMQKDAEFYRKNKSFTCTDCDNEAIAAEEQRAAEELNAEKRRRNKLPLVKKGLNKSETMPPEWDSCDQMILDGATQSTMAGNVRPATEPATDASERDAVDDAWKQLEKAKNADATKKLSKKQPSKEQAAWNKAKALEKPSKSPEDDPAEQFVF